MTAGTHHKHDLSSSEIDDLLDEALANPKVRAFLARPFKIVTSKDIPLLGSSSIGGGETYLDQHLRYRNWPFGIIPVGGVRFDTKPGLTRHERMELAVEDVFGWPYMPIAHPVATAYEHRLYRKLGFDPATVEKAYAPYIRSDEREPLKNVPTNLDLRPMLDDAKLLERTRASQDKQKTPQSSVGYTPHAKMPSQRCEVCAKFIQAKFGGPACVGVKSPISPSGWCRRFEKGSLGGWPD